MILIIIGIILCIIGIILIKKFSSIKIDKQKEIQDFQKLKQQENIKFLHFKQEQEENKKKIVNQIDYLKYQQNEYQKDLAVLVSLKEKNQKDYDTLVSKLTQIRKQSDNAYEQQKQSLANKLEDYKRITRQSANSYIDTLESSYKHAEAAHAEKMSSLKAEIDATAADLNKLKLTRKSAYEALLKQRQIKQNKDNYRLIPSSIDLKDITYLNTIKQKLSKPRILSMLIWQTFWQPLAKEKFPIILQDKTKMGIYKITNVITDQAYIGQSVDCYKRWMQHCKAGLGIDTPPGNKLYKAIQEYGLQNFTFQLLCQCDKEELNQKEKYFIELYQADLFGYNGTTGNKK